MPNLLLFMKSRGVTLLLRLLCMVHVPVGDAVEYNGAIDMKIRVQK